MKGTKREARLRFSSKTESLTDLWCFSEWKSPRSMRKNALKDLVFIINTKPRASFCTVILTVWDITVVTLSRDTNRELKERRRRRQRERQKSNWFRFAKQQLCTCITLFCIFLCRHCTTTTWKCLIWPFVEDGNTRQQLSFSFPELWYSPLEFNSKQICQHLTN